MIPEKIPVQGMIRLLAVYDGSNALLMRFEYADARMPDGNVIIVMSIFCSPANSVLIVALLPSSGYINQRVIENIPYP
jgi:hypothetical protein